MIISKNKLSKEIDLFKKIYKSKSNRINNKNIRDINSKIKQASILIGCLIILYKFLK